MKSNLCQVVLHSQLKKCCGLLLEIHFEKLLLENFSKLPEGCSKILKVICLEKKKQQMVQIMHRYKSLKL